jgi:hypothetical protein
LDPQINADKRGCFAKGYSGESIETARANYPQGLEEYPRSSAFICGFKAFSQT